MKMPAEPGNPGTGGHPSAIPAGCCAKHYPAVVAVCKTCRVWIDKQAKGTLNRQAHGYRTKG